MFFWFFSYTVLLSCEKKLEAKKHAGFAFVLATVELYVGIGLVQTIRTKMCRIDARLKKQYCPTISIHVWQKLNSLL